MTENITTMGYELHRGNAFQTVQEEYDEDSIHAVVTDPPYGVVEFETAGLRTSVTR